ncbi:hypothetical protein KCU95_g8, partial [Aureobasidium melanogenum]
LKRRFTKPFHVTLICRQNTEACGSWSCDKLAFPNYHRARWHGDPLLLNRSMDVVMINLLDLMGHAIYRIAKGDQVSVRRKCDVRPSLLLMERTTILEFAIKVVNLSDSPRMSLRADAPEWKFRLLCYWLFVRHNNLVFAPFGYGSILTEKGYPTNQRLEHVSISDSAHVYSLHKEHELSLFSYVNNSNVLVQRILLYNGGSRCRVHPYQLGAAWKQFAEVVAVLYLPVAIANSMVACTAFQSGRPFSLSPSTFLPSLCVSVAMCCSHFDQGVQFSLVESRTRAKASLARGNCSATSHIALIAYSASADIDHSSLCSIGHHPPLVLLYAIMMIDNGAQDLVSCNGVLPNGQASDVSSSDLCCSTVDSRILYFVSLPSLSSSSGVMRRFRQWRFGAWRFYKAISVPRSKDS